MNAPFPLLTSVPPRLSGEALVHQRDVVASWLAAGFRPVSVNGRSEIGQLAALDLDIEIEPASQDGKPLIGDIVTAIRKRGYARAGIINADCRIICYPHLAQRLARALDGSVLYAERVDVGDGRSPTLGECNGFDAFFFDAGVLGSMIDRHFRLGETWWDYWFPLQLAANGAMLGNVDIPLLFHRRHDARWNEEQWLHHARHTWAVLKGWRARGVALPFSSLLDDIEHLMVPDTHQLSAMGAACFQWLRARRLPREVTFLPGEMSNIEALLQEVYVSFSCRADLARELAAARAELTAAVAELAAVKTELAAFRSSTSWRITAPLRYLVSFIRQSAGRSLSTAVSR